MSKPIYCYYYSKKDYKYYCNKLLDALEVVKKYKNVTSKAEDFIAGFICGQQDLIIAESLYSIMHNNLRQFRLDRTHDNIDKRIKKQMPLIQKKFNLEWIRGLKRNANHESTLRHTDDYYSENCRRSRSKDRSHTKDSYLYEKSRHNESATLSISRDKNDVSDFSDDEIIELKINKLPRNLENRVDLTPQHSVVEASRSFDSVDNFY